MTIDFAKKSNVYLLIAISFFLVGCHHQEQAPAPQLPPVEVAIETVEPKTIPAVFEYVGVVQSSHEVEIRARVIGYLETIAFVEGTLVKKGDLLFQLDPRPFQTALARARAQLEREKAAYWQAQRAVKRFKPLYEQKAASQRDLDNAMAQEMAAEAQVMEAQAQVAEAELNLSYTTIRSPVEGLTSKATYRVGSLISPTQDLLTTVSVLDPIWVNFSVSEQDVLASQEALKKGRIIFPPNNEFEIELILADKSVYPEKGKLNFTAPSYSTRTGTLTVRATLSNPDNILRPGQYVRVRVLGAKRPNAITVPQQAVIQGEKGTFVFVVNDENRAELRPIEPGPWTDNQWVIYGGLQAGDRVIVQGVNKIVPGSLVTIKEGVSSKSQEAGKSSQRGKTGHAGL